MATPVEIVEAQEGAAYGAALLAGVGVGLWPDRRRCLRRHRSRRFSR